jgi:tetratricopeptide (TPR) repeat protein
MRCFVIRGFGKKTDFNGQTIDFDAIDRLLITPALKASGVSGGTTVEVMDAGSIHQDMFQLILKADIVICDITVHNANVFYELGVRHALRKRHTVLIKGDRTADKTPFDIAGMRYATYQVDNPGAAVDELVAAIKATLASDRETDSPVFLMMPDLPEANADHIVVVPLAFVERVQLAASQADEAALQALAAEAIGKSFERDGLKIVGRAQWALKDYEAAIGTWEGVRKGAEMDLAANLALANLYERQYKRSQDPGRLEASNQALQRVLARKHLSLEHRSECLALQGRNLKTLWRLAFHDLGTVEQRRDRAIDALAMASYAAYKAAQNADLNHFFPGLAALQMGRILQSLAQSPRFSDLFGGDPDEADLYVRTLKKELAAQEHVVRASIRRSLAAAEGEDLIWARISSADLLFLTRADDPLEAGHGAVVQAYRDAMPVPGGFYWDAARGQLALFEQLGIGAAAARAVMQELDPPPSAA